MSTRNPKFYNNAYAGSLSKETMDILDGIRKETVIPSLKHVIFNVPPDIAGKLVAGNIGHAQMPGFNILDYPGEARDEQTLAIAFMYHAKHMLLGDDTGFGKTVEIAGLINLLKWRKEMKRFVFVAEKNAVEQIQAKLIKFTGLRIVSLYTTAQKLTKQLQLLDQTMSTLDGIVVPHSMLSSSVFNLWWSTHLTAGKSKLFDALFFDESGAVKNKKTEMHESLDRVASTIVGYKIAMNATPVELSLKELYSQIDVVAPDALPSYSKISEMHCVIKQEPRFVYKGGRKTAIMQRVFKEYQHTEIFKESIRYFYFARSNPEVPAYYKVVPVRQTREQQKFISQGYPYRQVLNSISLAIPGHTITRENTPKLDMLVRLVETNPKEVFLVYCFFKEAQVAIQKELELLDISSHVLNGETADDDRFDIQHSINTKETRVLITNAQKSLDLYGATVCILYTIPDNPAAIVQIAGRVDRRVDSIERTYVLLMYKDTAEEKYFVDIVTERSKNASNLTIKKKTVVDKFCDEVMALRA